jgi:hypothetical protein
MSYSHFHIDGEFYINKKNAETLMVIFKNHSNISLTTWDHKEIYQFPKDLFDKQQQKKEFLPARFVLEYTYTYMGIDRPETYFRAFPNKKSLLNGLKSLNGRIPGESLYFHQFKLVDKQNDSVIYSGARRFAMIMAAESIKEKNTFFQATAINMRNLLQRVGLQSGGQHTLSQKKIKSR